MTGLQGDAAHRTEEAVKKSMVVFEVSICFPLLSLCFRLSSNGLISPSFLLSISFFGLFLAIISV